MFRRIFHAFLFLLLAALLAGKVLVKDVHAQRNLHMSGNFECLGKRGVIWLKKTLAAKGYTISPRAKRDHIFIQFENACQVVFRWQKKHRAYTIRKDDDFDVRGRSVVVFLEIFLETSLLQNEDMLLDPKTSRPASVIQPKRRPTKRIGRRIKPKEERKNVVRKLPPKREVPRASPPKRRALARKRPVSRPKANPVRRTLAVMRVKPPARRNLARAIPVKRVAGTPVRKVVVRTLPPRRKAVVKTTPLRRKVAARTVPPRRKVVVANPPRRKVVARVIPSKRGEVVVRRIPPKRSISRKVALVGGIKKSMTPQEEGWRFALSAAMSSALRGDFGVPFGGLLQLDVRLESFSLGVSVSFQQQFLLEQSDVSVLTPALIARWEFSRGAFFARLGAGVVAECLWVTNQQALVFAYRLGVRGELSLGLSLAKQLELYVGLAYHQFFTKDQFQRQGSDFFNVNPWQLHGFIGLTYRF